MKGFEFSDIVSALTHIRGGIPAGRLSTRIRLAEHKSAFFGPSYDLFDIQEYDPERDPPNQIISSLVGEDEDVIYARKCVEHHEVRIVFLVDLSSSIDAGVNFSKKRLLLESMGYIGVTGARYQDPIGMVGFTDKIVLNQPARCGVNNFYHLLGTLYGFLAESDPSKKTYSRRGTDFSAALEFLRRSFDKPCLVPMISDFVGFEKIVQSPLLKTVASRHELLFIFLDDPKEFWAGKGAGYIRMEDIEDGGRVVVSRRKMVELEKEIRQNRKQLRVDLKRMGIDSVVLEYGKHFNRLHRFFLARHKYFRV